MNQPYEDGTNTAEYGVLLNRDGRRNPGPERQQLVSHKIIAPNETLLKKCILETSQY